VRTPRGAPSSRARANGGEVPPVPSRASPLEELLSSLRVLALMAERRAARAQGPDHLHMLPVVAALGHAPDVSPAKKSARAAASASEESVFLRVRRELGRLCAWGAPPPQHLDSLCLQVAGEHKAP
jgi:hypothetical protein